MTMHRSAFVAALAAAALPLRVRAQAAPLPLRVGATANDTYAQAYYAADMGFFKKAGLAVELSTFTNGATVAQAVASGALDAGISNQVNLATAIIHNIPFALIAGGGLYSTNAPTSTLAVAKNASLRRAKDFEGKTVAVSSLKDLSYVAVVSWFEQNGADAMKVRYIELPFAQMGVSLDHGTVDGAVISEPSLSIANKTNSRTFGKCYDGIAKEFMISAWFATADLVKKSPDLVKRFAAAIAESGRWANANREQSGAILAAYAKLEKDTVAGMQRCVYAESLDPKLIQPILDSAYKFKLLDRAVSAGELFAKA